MKKVQIYFGRSLSHEYQCSEVSLAASGAVLTLYRATRLPLQYQGRDRELEQVLIGLVAGVVVEINDL